MGGIDYQLSSLSLSSTDQILIIGKARLLVDQAFKLTGQSCIVISTNASLDLYVKKGGISLAGNGIVNLAGNAANCTVYGLPEMTAVSMSGNGAFIGTIYAPNDNLKMTGSGNDVLDFSGAGIFNEITGTGNFTMTRRAKKPRDHILEGALSFFARSLASYRSGGHLITPRAGDVPVKQGSFAPVQNTSGPW